MPYDNAVERPRGVEVFPEAALRAVLPPATKRRGVATPGPARCYRFSVEDRRRVLRVDSAAPAPCPTVRAAQDALEGELAIHVAASCPDRVFLHAGVVSFGGKALLLPGRSFAGKSTLVAALVAAGGTYYSDEYAVVDGAGLVFPYPRRLSLRREGALPRRTMPARVGRRAVPVGWVLGARYVPGASFAPVALSQGRTALLLLDNAVAARIVPGRVLHAVRAIAASAMGIESVRGDVAAAVKHLLPLLAGERRLAPAVT